MAGRILPSAVPASWLRVYEPLGAFSKEDRAHWAAYAFGPDAGTEADLVERTVAWRRLLTRGAVLDAVTADAVAFREPDWFEDDLSAFSPLLAAGDPTPPGAPPGATPGVPPGPLPDGFLGAAGRSGPDVAPGERTADRTADRTAGRHEGTSRDAGTSRDVRTHAHVLRVAGGDPLICPVPAYDRALTQAWRLPLEWLLLVQADDVLTGDLPGRYVVPMARCRTRAARVLRTVRRGLGEVPVADRLASTARWLERFHPRSAVEIDARSVTEIVGEDGRDDVHLGLEALAEGDATTMAAAYRRIRRREELLRGISRAS